MREGIIVIMSHNWLILVGEEGYGQSVSVPVMRTFHNLPSLVYSETVGGVAIPLGS